MLRKIFNKMFLLHLYRNKITFVAFEMFILVLRFFRECVNVEILFFSEFKLNFFSGKIFLAIKYSTKVTIETKIRLNRISINKYKNHVKLTACDFKYLAPL